MKLCLICNDLAEYHHLYTRKARPELANSEFNKIPVCRSHHTMFHQKGTSFMANQYKPIETWLKQHNWIKCPVLLKWVHK